MKVFLFRHAEAEDTVPDEARRLTKRGRTQVKQMAQGLRGELFAEVSEVWHSTLVRARQTAELFREGCPVLQAVPLHEVEGLEPEAEIEAMAELLARCEGDVLVVGHNPFMEALVTCLVSGEVGTGMVVVRKAAMLCLERQVGISQGFPWGMWTLRWHVEPELLKT